MKTNPAFLLLIASTLTSAFMSQVASASPVTRAIWNCKGDGKGYVSALSATADPEKGSALGSLLDGSMSSEPISLSQESPAYELTGGIHGHDVREYSVLLLPTSAYDFLASSSRVKTTGTAIVAYSGFIDCVGDVSGTETLSCEIELER